MENPLKYSLSTRFKEKYFIDFLWPDNKERVLEIGCGLGYLLSLFEPSNGDLYGLDISLSSLIVAKKMVKANFVLSDAQILPFKNNSFHKILFADVLEHLADDSEVLKEIYRICKHSSFFVISTPALEGLITKTFLKHWMHGEDDLYQKDYKKGYSAYQLKKILAKNNFIVKKINYSNFYLTEILMLLLKLGYFLKKRRYASQEDLISINESSLFKVYKKYIFPIFFLLGKIEEIFLKNFIPGHCLIISCVVEKK